MKREEGSQHSGNCSGCSGFIGQEENQGAELTVATELQQMSHDRTEIRSDPVPETEPTPIRDSNHDPTPIPDSDPAPIPDSDSALPTCQLVDEGVKHKQQQVIGSRTCEET